MPNITIISYPGEPIAAGFNRSIVLYKYITIKIIAKQKICALQAWAFLT